MITDPLITTRHLEVYEKFRGDGDMFARCTDPQYQMLFNNGQWHCIDDHLQNLWLIKRGIVSGEFRDRIMRDINRLFEPAAIQRMLLLAGK